MLRLRRDRRSWVNLASRDSRGAGRKSGGSAPAPPGRWKKNLGDSDRRSDAMRPSSFQEVPESTQVSTKPR